MFRSFDNSASSIVETVTLVVIERQISKLCHLRNGTKKNCATQIENRIVRHCQQRLPKCDDCPSSARSEIKSELQTNSGNRLLVWISAQTYARAVKFNWLFNFSNVKLFAEIQLSLIFIDSVCYNEWTHWTSRCECLPSENQLAKEKCEWLHKTAGVHWRSQSTFDSIF